MTPEEQIKNLREQIAYHSDRYYNQDNPEISAALLRSWVRSEEGN